MATANVLLTILLVLELMERKYVLIPQVIIITVVLVDMYALQMPNALEALVNAMIQINYSVMNIVWIINRIRTTVALVEMFAAVVKNVVMDIVLIIKQILLTVVLAIIHVEVVSIAMVVHVNVIPIRPVVRVV